MAADRYKLKLTSLKFISAVDEPAQETAKAVLFKSKDGPQPIATFVRVAKLSDDLGLVFGWALTSKAAGADYYDLHGDNILEEDLIKVAAEFLAAGGDTDEMHDSNPDGHVVFAMPLTAEVAKAFGIRTDTTGLMVAIKPSPEVFAKFKSGELTGFSIAGTGERTPIEKMPRATRKAAVAFAKRAMLLTPVEGHTHLLDDGDGAGSGYTSTESIPDDEDALPDGGYSDPDYHAHPWVRQGDVIVIGMAEGHTHAVLDVATPESQMTDENPMDAAADAMAAADSTMVSASKSPPSIAARKVNTMTTKLVVLTEAQGQHYQSLAGADAEAFASKSSTERDAEVAKAAAANPIVFQGEVTKTVVRLKDGALALQLAQQAESGAVELAKAKEQIEKSNAHVAHVELVKRANATIGHLAGPEDAHVALLKAAESIPDAKVREAAIATLKSADAAMAKAGAPKGFGGIDVPMGGDPDAAMVALEKGLVGFCKAQSITKNLWTDGLAAFTRTPEGEALKRAYDESLAG